MFRSTFLTYFITLKLNVMNLFKIIGESKPDRIKLLSPSNKRVSELPKRSLRKMVDDGLIQIVNPESLFIHL
jgi:hypothetical protein